MTVEACRKRREYLVGVMMRINKELEELNKVIKADNIRRYEEKGRLIKHDKK